MKSISYYVKHLFSKRWTKVALIAALLITPAVLTGCGKQNANQGNTVSVGVATNNDDQLWKDIGKRLKKQGVHIKINTFSDYNQPNKALQYHEDDINAFQTVQFLNTWNKSNHAHLVRDGNTIIAPLALYSQKINKLGQLKKHSTIALPNDASNEARSLNLLQTAGLIKLKKTALPTINDVISNKKDLKLEPVNAAQTPRALKDTDASIINAAVASDAHLTPNKAVYVEKVNSKVKPYINIIATTKSEKNRKAIKKVIKAFHTKATANDVKKLFHGNEIPAWNLNLK